MTFGQDGQYLNLWFVHNYIHFEFESIFQKWIFQKSTKTLKNVKFKKLQKFRNISFISIVEFVGNSIALVKYGTWFQKLKFIDCTFYIYQKCKWNNQILQLHSLKKKKKYNYLEILTKFICNFFCNFPQNFCKSRTGVIYLSP